MLYGTIILLFILSACSTISPKPSGPPANVGERSEGASGPEIYRVGGLEVRVYKEREAMVRDLPELPKLVDGMRFGARQLRIYGYYDRPNNRIYTINHIPTLIHELKHFLEPDWEHPSPITADVQKEGRRGRQPTVESAQHPMTEERLPFPRLSCLPTCLR